MSGNTSKIVIVGCGNVGCAAAYTLVNQGLCHTLVLIDVNKDKAYAEALDLTHADYFMSRHMEIIAGDYSDCKDADIVIITAAAPMPKDSHDRLKMLEPSMNIMKSIVSSVMSSGFSGIFLVISNPVDIMTYFVYKLSGLPRSQVIGSGTNLDTARLRYEISRMYDLDPKSVDAFVIGEHGDSEVTVWHDAVIGGKSMKDVFDDNKERTVKTKAELQKETIEAGWDIFNRKGNTCYGIASSAAAIVKAILLDEKAIIPVTAGLNGEFGIDHAWLSVPVVLDRFGVREIVEIDLEEDEKEALQKSAAMLESFYEELPF